MSPTDKSAVVFLVVFALLIRAQRYMQSRLHSRNRPEVERHRQESPAAESGKPDIISRIASSVLWIATPVLGCFLLWLIYGTGFAVVMFPFAVTFGFTIYYGLWGVALVTCIAVFVWDTKVWKRPIGALAASAILICVGYLLHPASQLHFLTKNALPTLSEEEILADRLASEEADSERLRNSVKKEFKNYEARRELSVERIKLSRRLVANDPDGVGLIGFSLMLFGAGCAFCALFIEPPQSESPSPPMQSPD